MCGVAITINSNVDQVVNNILHRGPDSQGAWKNCTVEIGHSRLSILDLTDAGRQPMETSRYVLSFNGELYSYLEMKQRLTLNDDLGLTNLPQGNDAKTFLLYIEKFGLNKALADANGMFAFILYDKIDQIVYMAVDRFSQKPLYWFNKGEIFAAASSPSALLHLKDKWKINERALQSYWALGSVMHHSLWDGIKKINASEKVTYDIKAQTIKIERYWQPKFIENTSHITDLVLDSIEKVKVSDVPVYLFLSGGIDSTTVASQCQGMNAIHLDGPELKYAREAAAKFWINLHVVSPKEVDATIVMKDYVEKCGEPGASALMPYITSKEASRYCKVAISANGADEAFHGYSRTNDEITEFQLSHIFRLGYRDFELPEIDDRFPQGRWLEFQTYIQHDLNKVLDFSSMASSLEVRNPFLDHRLVECALSIPQKQHGNKEILKNILRAKGFGNDFLNRPKLGFSLYKKPSNYDIEAALKWAINEKWLPNQNYSARDHGYLAAAAFSFKIWMETFKDKIA